MLAFLDARSLARLETATRWLNAFIVERDAWAGVLLWEFGQARQWTAQSALTVSVGASPPRWTDDPVTTSSPSKQAYKRRRDQYVLLLLLL